MVEKVREIEPEFNDPLSMPSSIAERAVQKFCAGCDMLQTSTGICRAVGENDQARYAVRKWCSWASVNRIRGQMTAQGFRGPEK